LYFADESGGEWAPDAFTPGPCVILTGPEGGFTEEERTEIRSAPNAVPVSLGPRILRAETAALAALTAYMAVAGDWR
ncbi:MAG: RsmE family RNA methyltransferase, partial [Alphaproteobacteria bacterium]